MISLCIIMINNDNPSIFIIFLFDFWCCFFPFCLSLSISLLNVFLLLYADYPYSSFLISFRFVVCIYDFKICTYLYTYIYSKLFTFYSIREFVRVSICKNIKFELVFKISLFIFTSISSIAVACFDSLLLLSFDFFLFE